jgi:excisionase family DNA binding protein
MKSKRTSGNQAARPETTISSPVVSKTTQAQLPLAPSEQQLVFDKITQPPLPTAAIAEPWVTAATIAKHFGMGLRTLRRYVADQDLPHHSIGRQMRFKISEVQAFLDRLHADRFAAVGRENTLAEARKRLVVIPILEGVQMLSETRTPATTKQAPTPSAGKGLTPQCKPGRKALKPATVASCVSGHHRWRTSQYTRTCADCGRTEERDATNQWVAE